MRYLFITVITFISCSACTNPKVKIVEQEKLVVKNLHELQQKLDYDRTLTDSVGFDPERLDSENTWQYGIQELKYEYDSLELELKKY